MEKSRSVSRCVAIASHGRRCQQSPFRGSPYCWHHTQSRKIFAPSRLTAGSSASVRLLDGAAGGRPEDPGVHPERRVSERRGGERRATARGELEQARRLAQALGPERTEELLRVLEEGGPGAYIVIGDDVLAAGRRRAGRAGG